MQLQATTCEKYSKIVLRLTIFLFVVSHKGSRWPFQFWRSSTEERSEFTSESGAGQTVQVKIYCAVTVPKQVKDG